MQKKILDRIDYVQLTLDLIIVFIGVTLAFVFTRYQEENKATQRTEQVVSLLVTGLDMYEDLFGGFVLYLEEFNAKFREKLDSGELPNFESETFPAPQYPIDAISLLSDQSFETLTPEVHIKLTEFSNAIRRLIYTEQKMVDASEKYTYIPKNQPFAIPELYRIEQIKWARNYLKYSEIRKRTSKELQIKSRDLRVLLEKAYPDIVNN